MKKNIFLFFLAVCLSCTFFSCGGVNKKTLKRVQLMEEKVASPSTPDELKQAIKKFERRAEDLIATNEQVGVWYKILATRYLDKQMYAEALDALENAIHYYPSNQNLFYYVGVSAGYMAKASLDFRATGSTTERDRYLLLSESGYVRAIELDPRFARALYGLGVLYTFEMNQPAKAIPLLEELLTIEKKNTEGMMVLARAYYMVYDFDSALAMYDRIISTSTAKDRVAEAEKNKRIVLDAMYQQ